MKRNRDILLAARPDQSLEIYHALECQDDLTFQMIVFKVVRTWIKTIVPYKKLNTVGRDCHILWWGTFKHLAIKKYAFSFAKRWSDSNIFDPSLRRFLKHYQYGIIHFWPENGGKPITEYAENNPNCFVIADIHMPQPQVVYDEMVPVYNRFGIKPESTHLFELVREQEHYLDNVDNVLVPSGYVADTYKSLFPNKNYFIVPYGISVSRVYQTVPRSVVRDFFYAGGITLEKGCDLLLEYFSNHPEYNLHLFGSIATEQTAVFERYKSAKNICFHGHIAKADLQAEFSKYDVGIHLSRFDAYSLAVGEMIGAGKPVIVSDKTGNMDDVIKYGFGLVTELSMECVESAIRKMTIPKTYNSFVDNIDSFVKSNNKGYGERMIEFYKEHLKYE